MSKPRSVKFQDPEAILIDAVVEAAMAYVGDGEVKLLTNQRQFLALYDACSALRAFRERGSKT